MAEEDDDPNGIPSEDEDEGPAAETPAAAPDGWRRWLEGRRGWIVIGVIALLQAVFATVMILLKGGGKPPDDGKTEVQALAVEMLGREVAIRGINQLIAGPGGRRLTIGLDLVLVLGQLPEERIAGAPRPTAEEFEAFTQAIADMEPRIRSRMNSLLQKIAYDEYGSPEIYERIKKDIMQEANRQLEGLAFSRVRPEIGKRRVTDVLLPMFVRQTL